MTGFYSKQDMAADKNKRGSIALARSLCYEISGATNGDDDFSGSDYGSVDVAEILSAEVERLREALAQPAQEPVAWRWSIKKLNGGYEWRYTLNKTRPDSIPLYAVPQKRNT